MLYQTVSICTPTRDRRAFIPALIKCYLAQDYPRNLLEWIVFDDGADPVEDLFYGVPGVRYTHTPHLMPIGFKRNRINEKAQGEILIYMDDDDYYPPSRVQHAVERMLQAPHVGLAGCRGMFMYFQDTDEIYELGPYNPNHATAASFALWRRLLDYTAFQESDRCNEEQAFTCGNHIQMVELEFKETMLVMAHPGNTVDNNPIRENPDHYRARRTEFTIADFISDPDLLEFYSNGPPPPHIRRATA